MKRVWQTVMLNGKVWQLDTVHKVARYTKPSRTIHEAYAKPSATKVEIWNEWYEYFQELGADYITVCSKNSNFFTILAYFEHEGITYRAWVTSTRQELAIVDITL